MLPSCKMLPTWKCQQKSCQHEKCCWCETFQHEIFAWQCCQHDCWYENDVNKENEKYFQHFVFVNIIKCCKHFSHVTKIVKCCQHYRMSPTWWKVANTLKIVYKKNVTTTQNDASMKNVPNMKNVIDVKNVFDMKNVAHIKNLVDMKSANNVKHVDMKILSWQCCQHDC